MGTKNDLILMEKEGERMAVDATTVESHKMAGWKVVGMETRVDGKVAEMGEVIETPAHTVETSDGFLKTLPKFDETGPAVPVEKTGPKPKK